MIGNVWEFFGLQWRRHIPWASGNYLIAALGDFARASNAACAVLEEGRDLWRTTQANTHDEIQMENLKQQFRKQI